MDAVSNDGLMTEYSRWLRQIIFGSSVILGLKRTRRALNTVRILLLITVIKTRGGGVNRRRTCISKKKKICTRTVNECFFSTLRIVTRLPCLLQKKNDCLTNLDGGVGFQ